MIHPKLTATRWFAGAVLALSAAGVLAAEQLSPQVRTAYVKVDAPVIALTNARVIDGTGGPVRQAQTIVIRDGVIAAIGRCTRRDGTGRRHDHRPRRKDASCQAS